MGFEIWAPIEPLYKSGRYEEAAALGTKVADEYPQYTMVLYNVACCEALAGRPDDAIRHLQHGDLRERRTSRNGPPGTRTSSRSAMTRASRSWWARSTAP